MKDWVKLCPPHTLKRYVAVSNCSHNLRCSLVGKWDLWRCAYLSQYEVKWVLGCSDSTWLDCSHTKWGPGCNQLTTQCKLQWPSSNARILGVDGHGQIQEARESSTENFRAHGCLKTSFPCNNYPELWERVPVTLIPPECRMFVFGMFCLCVMAMGMYTYLRMWGHV